MDVDHKFNHPSYATVQFNRMSGGEGTPLFGTPLKDHYTLISLTVRHATRHYRLSEDRIIGEGEIVNLWMSGAQFVELLTTMNIGTGVPATIRFTEKEGPVDFPPDENVEAKLITDGFGEKLHALDEFLLQSYADAEKLLQKRSLSKKDRETLLWIIGKTRQEVRSNWPFVLEQFRGATERVISHAKAEVDSFIQRAIEITGFKALKEKNAARLIDGPREESAEG